MNIKQILNRREAIRTELRQLHDAAHDGALGDAAATRWTELEAELGNLDAQERRTAALDDLDRRAAGQPVDAAYKRLTAGLGLMDAVRAQMGGTDTAAGRAREASQEMERRSGRKAEGLYWDMGMEQRVLTSTLPAGGPGGNIIPTDYRPELFMDRLRNATRVRALGATVIAGLHGNLIIPRRKASVVSGWAAENTPLTVSDPQFDGVTFAPKHAGIITEWSRNMALQSSPDVEALARDDMAKVLAETLDAAAIAGTGANAQPTGLLNTPGIGAVAIGTNGGPLTYDAVADLMGQVDDANADGTSMGFLTNTKVRRAAGKLKDTQGRPLGLPVVFQGGVVATSNLVPSGGTKGTGTNLSTLIYANWADLILAVWSELDILVNPYESTAYSKGNVSIRAMLTCDVGVRHPQSFAAISDIVA